MIKQIKTYVSILCLITVIPNSLTAQNTVYQTLYTDATFNKSTNTGLPVGVIDGQHGTTQAGAAMYSIPLKITPGINNMEPHLMVTYNSQSGNGLLGYGWGLSGLSTITLTNKNSYNDGEVNPIQIDKSNPFTLDGIRLIPISGNNGSAGTTYSKEVEDFSLITSNANTTNCSTCPQWFKVDTKDGFTSEYGNTSNSVISATQAGGIYPYIWRINKMTDNNGNYIEYIYEDINGENRIRYINYTGNGSTTPTNKITFNYSVRTDKNDYYFNTTNFANTITRATIKSNSLLDNIEITTENGTVLVKKYEFFYAYDGLYSVLQEVKEKGSDGSELNSTIFKYGNPTDINNNTNTISANYTNLVSTTGSDNYSGDFDGDGITDIFTAYYGIFTTTSGVKHKIYYNYKIFKKIAGNNVLQEAYSLNSLTSMPNYLGFINVTVPVYKIGDYNGDGRSDILIDNYIYPTNTAFTFTKNDMSILYSTSSSSAISFTNVPITNTNFSQYNKFLYRNYNGEIANRAYPPVTGDFDGDGATDIIHTLATNVTYTAGTNGYNASCNCVTLNSTGGQAKAFISFPAKGEYYLPLVNESYFLPAYITNGTKDVTGSADFDGDGKDEVYLKNPLTVLSINKNSSNQYQFNFKYVSFAGSDDLIPDVNKNIIGDFNGDGKADILRKKNNTFYTYYSTGGGSDININNGGFNVVQFPLSTNTVNIFNNSTEYLNTKILAADFNGDGKCDVIFQNLNVANNKMILDIYYSSGMGYIYIGKKEISTSSKYTADILGDFNGDGSFDILNKSNDNHSYNGKAFMLIDFGNQRKERLLKKVIDGFGRKTEFDYKLLTDAGAFYQIGSYPSGITYNPIKLFQAPFYCVSSIKTPDGVGGDVIDSYNYIQAKFHNQGKGFLGFNKIIEKNSITNFVIETENHVPTISNFFTALPYKVRVYPFGSSTDISNNTYLYTFNNLGNNRFFASIHDLTSNDFIKGIKVNEHYDYDNNGNITYVSSDINDGYESSATSFSNFGTFANSPVPNLPTSILEYRVNNSSSFTKNTKIMYDANGRTTEVTDFFGQPNKVTTNYTYDNFGNINTTIKTGLSNGSTISITSNSPYQPNGRYIKEAEIQGVIEKILVATNDVRWAKPTLISNLRGNHTVQLTYDAFGKTTNIKPSITSPANFDIKTDYTWSSAFNSKYLITTTPLGMASTKRYYDIFDRLTREEKIENGKTKFTEYIYNAKGEIETSKMNDADGVAITTTYNYDVYHRLLSSTPTVGPSSTNTYTSSTNGYSISTTLTGNPSKTTQIDAVGRVIGITETGLTNNYTYHVNGNILKVTQDGKDLVVCTYDQYGNQKTLKDIDANVAGKENKYEYDAFGNLTKQTDAKGNIISLIYDQYGRLGLKGMNDAFQSSNNTIELYAYNTLFENGPGKLKNRIRLGLVNSSLNLMEEYSYDNLDRFISLKKTFEGNEYITSNTYGDYDRVNNVTYPSVQGSDPVTVNYIQTADGFITQVNTNIAGSLKNIFNTSSANNYNAFNQIKSFSLGNNLSSQRFYNKLGMPTKYLTNVIFFFNFEDLRMEWDLNNGNLTKRIDASNNNRPTTTETFIYDGFNRLTGSTIGTQTNSVGYNAIGNITNKFDAGSQYDYFTDRIHAVKTIKSNVFDSPLPTRPQMPSHPSNERNDINIFEQNIIYNAFNQPDLITEGKGDALEPLIKKMKFIYDLDGNRIKSTYTEETNGILDASKTVKRYYFGNYEFEKDNADVIVRQLTYINSPAGLSCIYLKENTQSGNHFFTYTDHLGSIVAVTAGNGIPVAYQSFDAWGRARSTYDWSYNNITAPPAGLYRGFTGHEMLPQFDLINMNGRLYDPKVGRMLSPDNFVQDPFSTQGFNRYSYVWNNPLKYTDPSGETTNFVNPDSYLRSMYFSNGTSDVSIINIGGGGALSGGSSGGFNHSPGFVSPGTPNSGFNPGTLMALSSLVNIGISALAMAEIAQQEKKDAERKAQNIASVNNNISTVGNANNAISSGDGVVVQNRDMNTATASLNNPYKGHIKPLEPHNNDFLRTYHKAELSEHINEAMSMNMLRSMYGGYTIGELLNELPANNNYHSFGEGPADRFIVDPLYFNVVIDFKHFLYSIIRPSSLGDYNENKQEKKNNQSAHNPQDYYSNNLGNRFYNFYRTKQPNIMLPHDKNLIEYIIEFLNSLTLRKNN